MPGHDEKPIFEAEEAPPTAWEQIVAALRPRRSSTRAAQKVARPQGARNVLIAMGKSLVGAIGGVLFMLGILGVSMSVLLAVSLLVTKIQNLSMGINWVVAPISFGIFAVVGAVGYVVLRSVGMVTPKRRRTR